MSDAQRAPWRDIASYAPIAIFGGGVFAFLANGMRWDVRIFLHGGVIGFCCFCGAVAGEILFRRWLEAAPGQWWRRAIVYFVGGQIGFPIGLLLGLTLIWRQPISSIRLGRGVWIVVLVSGAIGTLVGLAAHGYEALKDRLRDSIGKVKEAEFAEKELELARELQSRMLPPPEISGDGYHISARNYAARYVAGDFYDVFRFADGSIGIAVADVAGKGLAASLIMASVKAVLPLLATNRSAGEAMAALNEKLVGELSRREFVAMLLVHYDAGTRRVTLVNAGLPDPYLIRRHGALETVEVSGPRLPLGLRRGMAYEQKEVTLNGGDALILFSDGLPEATMTDGEQLGYERLAGMVRDAGASVDAIVERVHAATSATREDDQTIVMLQICD